jgi:hypothetical protein
MVNQAGTASANGFSGVPVFNADGTRLAFVSTATDLGAPGRSTSATLYVKDMPDGATNLVALDNGPDQDVFLASVAPPPSG